MEEKGKREGEGHEEREGKGRKRQVKGGEKAKGGEDDAERRRYHIVRGRGR